MSIDYLIDAYNYMTQHELKQIISNDLHDLHKTILGIWHRSDVSPWPKDALRCG